MLIKRNTDKIESSEYARDIQLALSSNVDGAGAKDSMAQIMINCSTSLNKCPVTEVDGHLSRLADEYVMAQNTALNLLRNRPLFLLISRVLQFPHHQNQGKPNVKMFTSWGVQNGHGPVCYQVSSLPTLIVADLHWLGHEVDSDA